MIHLVTFASDDMSISAQRCVDSALRMGVQDYDLWNYDDLIDRPSPLNRIRIEDRGVGYWAWKPFIVDDLICSTTVKDNDLIVYSDAGVEFIEPVSIVIDRMDQDIWLFGNETFHSHWCKRDIIDEVYAGHEMGIHRFWTYGDDGRLDWGNFGRQCQASVIFFRVNNYTRAFVKEWLDWCLFEGGRLIDDSPSRLPNHPEFKENRHDQAILTTLAYREGIKLHHWYVRYHDRTPGRGPFYPNDNYPPLYLHHRRRNHEWEQAA